VSNFPLSYRLSWLPRLLKPSLAGDTGDFSPMEQRLLAAGPTARLVFLGDISAVANAEPPEIDPALWEVIAAADLVVANCESPLVEHQSFPVARRLGTRHAMTPVFLDEVIAAAGIDPAKLVLSLANNHVLDQGISGFEETVSALQKRGVTTIGAAGDGLVRRIEVGPLSVGFLAFTRWRNASAQGFAGRVTMADDIGGWRRHAGAIDLVCAVPHWDLEFRHFPGDETRALARRLGEEGAGLIVGGHAHVVQPVERFSGTLVAYGLGDFLGTALPWSPWPLRIGAMLAVEVSTDAATRGKIAAYRIVPFLRERQGRHERLVAMEAAEASVTESVRRRLEQIFRPA
jgi:poly-gamma-glutamate synthesis protein (capsule biosynthesis protein)